MASQRGVITNMAARFESSVGEARMQKGMALMTDDGEASVFAASITFLPSDDDGNVNGVVLPSVGSWLAV
jgi:hypothetical protein